MIIYDLLRVIYTILSIICAEVMIYQFFMMFGMFAKKIDMPEQKPDDKINRFAILIAARNERNVIGHLVESLIKQDYPREMFDVFVIADNCTDDTASVARKAGAFVFERFNTVQRGKGEVLNELFNCMKPETLARYDAFCVFDADNLADNGYLRAMNAHINAGDMLIQGNRMAKNPYDSWISGCYHMYFRGILQIFLRSRRALELSGSVGGTGFAFSAELVRKHGWQTFTLTEDIEYSIQTMLRGNPAVPAYDAVFYDEQPVTFKASLRQRYRWTLGTMQCMERYLKDFCTRMFSKNKNVNFNERAMCLDMIVFLLSGPISALVAVNTLIGFLIMIISGTSVLGVVYAFAVWLAGFYGALFASGIIGCLLSKVSFRGMGKALIGWPVFLISWQFINLTALFYRKTDWTPIPHVVTISVSEQQARLEVQNLYRFR